MKCFRCHEEAKEFNGVLPWYCPKCAMVFVIYREEM
jgi:phage FluMu protein Com